MATTKEMEFLELRQQLKESLRKKMGKENNYGQQSHGVLLSDKSAFGSYFGPSHTVISGRVMPQASGLASLQNKVQRLKVQLEKNSNGQNKIGHQEKIRKLRESRDYSFLFSDDRDGTLSRKLIVKPSSSRSNVVSKENNTSSGSDNMGTFKTNIKIIIKLPPLVDKPIAYMVRAAPKQEVSQQPKKAETMPISKQVVQDLLKMGLQQPNKPKTMPMPKQELQASLKMGLQQPHKAATMPKQAVESSLNMGLQQSDKAERILMPKQAVHGSLKIGLQQTYKAERMPMPKRPVQDSLKTRLKISHAPLQNSYSKRRPQDQYMRKKYPDDEDEGVNEAKEALNMIRKKFNTQRFAGRNDSDVAMEASYQDILKEERKSAKLARKEDSEQLRLNQEEERKEKAKKRKLSHH